MRTYFLCGKLTNTKDRQSYHITISQTYTPPKSYSFIQSIDAKNLRDAIILFCQIKGLPTFEENNNDAN